VGTLSKVIAGNFKNTFTETSGFVEHGKHFRGLEMNNDRLFVTHDGVFLIGNSEAGGPKGFGGAAFRIWKTDGTVQEVEDVWRLSSRIDEQITVLKMEGDYTPYDGSHVRISFIGSSVSRDNCLLICIPWSLKEPINSNRVEIIAKEKAIEICLELTHTASEFDAHLYRKLAQMIQLSAGNSHVLFSFENDRAAADYRILKMIFDGESDYETYAVQIMESSWRWSITPYSEMLAAIKASFYRDSLHGSSRGSFLRNILEFRSKLCPQLAGDSL
jgi:hypothetical protein